LAVIPRPRMDLSLRARARVEIIDEFATNGARVGPPDGTEIAANDYGLTYIAARSLLR
jgi:hypothetical protein